MRRWLWVPICCAALVVPVVVLAGSGERGFDGVVSAIERQYQVQATRIPFLALANYVSNAATHGGVSGVHVAEFEHFDKPVDGEALNQTVAEKLGSGWDRMIRDTSRHGKELTLIFAHPEGNRMGLLVVDLNGNELNVVQVSVDPDHLHETIGKYKHHDGNESD